MVHLDFKLLIHAFNYYCVTHLAVLVNVVLNRTVVVDSDWCFNNLCSSHLQSQSELYHVSWWYYTLVIDLIGQLRHDVIGRLPVKPWCYWLWRLVISDWTKCCNCQASYIGETGRNLNTWLTKHKRRQGMVMSTISLLSIIYRWNIKLTGTLQHV